MTAARALLLALFVAAFVWLAAAGPRGWVVAPLALPFAVSVAAAVVKHK